MVGIYLHDLIGYTVVESHLPTSGAWLRSYDADAHDGRGYVDWTTDPDQALKFPDAASAISCYRSVPSVRPVRMDGQPNRPLTAFTIEIRRLP